MKSKKFQSEIKFLLQIIDESFEKKAWHGPNLRGSIRGLTAKQAAWRPNPRQHNIWEIVVHAAYWKYVVRRRILGEKRGSFPLKGSNWFKRPNMISENSWKKDVGLLVETHHSMRAAIAGLSPKDLHARPPGAPSNAPSNAALIAGIAFHDVYHAGQIQLLKRLARHR